MGYVDDNLDNEKEIYDIENFGINIRLKPDYYIHLALQQLTRVFDGDVTETEGFKKYVHLIHHLEILVRSAKMLPKNYEDEIKTISNTEKYKSLGKVEADVFLAREKFNLFIGSVFGKAPATGAIYLFENQDGSTSSHKERYERRIKSLEKDNA